MLRAENHNAMHTQRLSVIGFIKFAFSKAMTLRKGGGGGDALDLDIEASI